MLSNSDYLDDFLQYSIFLRIVTRSKASWLVQFKIKGCFVSLPRSYSSLALDWLRTTVTHFDLKKLSKQETSNHEAGPSHQPDETQPIEQIDGRSHQPLLTELLNTMNEIQVPTFNVENDSHGIHGMALVESIEPANYQVQVNETLADVNRPKRPLPPLLPICEPPKKLANRRGSVAGGMMFSVENEVTERASDNLEKVPRASGSIIVQGGILNEFDPFRRTKNISFSLKGRPRASSVSCQRRPSLSTLWESNTEGDYMSQKVENRRVSIAESPAGPTTNQENIAPVVDDVEQLEIPAPSNWNETVKKWVGRFNEFN